ncbi:hypothetical protein ACOJCY_003364 [Cronobacter dublinensis]
MPLAGGLVGWWVRFAYPPYEDGSCLFCWAGKRRAPAGQTAAHERSAGSDAHPPGKPPHMNVVRVSKAHPPGNRRKMNVGRVSDAHPPGKPLHMNVVRVATRTRRANRRT